MPTAFTRGAASALAFGWGKAVAAVDQFFEYVTYLLPGNGTNGAQNNTFIDSSANNFTITRSGNATQGTYTPYGSNWSNYVASSAFTVAPSNAVFGLPGVFTLEFFIAFSVLPTANPMIGRFGAGGFNVYCDGTRITPNLFGTGNIFNSTWLLSSITLNTWYHVVIARNASNVMTMYVNGTSVGSTTTSTTYATGTWSMGNTWNGYLSNLRITNTNVYGGTVTVPTAPLTAITGTQLLACQSNRFIDNSPNNFTLTVTGSPNVQRFSPFNPTASYDASTIGGSAYFDGTTDYLTAAANAAFAPGTGDFTIECWVNFSTLPTSNTIAPICQNDADFTSSSSIWWLGLFNNAGTMQLALGRHATSSRGTVNWVPTVGTWNHIVAERQSGTVLMFINGVQQTVATNTALSGVNFGQEGFMVGAISTPYYLRGYIAGLRYTVGSAVYTASFTPPTAPVSTVSGTQLLLSSTNAGIIDNAMVNDIETLGNAQISTAQSKFGGSSIYFDGNGDYLFSPDNPMMDLSGGSFTIEFWIYRAATGDFMPIEKTINGQFGSWYIQFTSATNVISWNCSSTGASNNMFNNVSFGTLPSLNTWYHVAVVRNGSTFTGYVDGVGTSIGTSTATIFRSTYGITVGAHNGSASFYLNGYMDDIRITRGVARYTGNFTPPTAPFPTQ